MPPDQGDSLIEVLVALAVLGIGITGLLTAVSTHITTTTINRDQSQIETTLVSAAEYVKSLPFSAFTGCTPTGWTNLTTSTVPHDPAFTVEYGNARQQGATPCATLTVVSVRVTGNGFQNMTLDLTKRP
ncbi:MAG: hypothetical protein JWL79_3606 [Frankiales bacterium]|nr:hypothetical protein [Frankiales bacterium]